MNGVLLAARIGLALVFLVAALTKLADHAGSRTAMEAFGVPQRLSGAMAWLLPAAELAAAVLLLITGTARIGAALALCLLLLFCAGMTRSIIRGESPDCHCFGQLHSAPAGPRTLLRNAGLAGVAGLVLVGGPGTSATHWIGQLSGAALAALIGGVAAALLAVAMGAVVLSLLRRHGELLLRIDRLEETLAERGIVVAEPAPRPAGLPVGSPAPEFELPDLEGELVSLAALISPERPLLLTFTDPGCGPCSALLPRIAEWQREYAERLLITPISRGGVDANLAHAREHGVNGILVQSDREVLDSYQVNGTPGAVLIAPDGTIASPIHGGADAISALVGAVVSPASLQVQHSGPGVGHPAPDVGLLTVDGQASRLSERLDGRTAVLFWNPGCGFCQRMLPDLRRFDEDPPAEAPSIVLVSTGDAASNEELGLRAPVLLDDSFAAGSAFGATGTPSAVLVDEEGRIASPIAVGAPAVLELVGAKPVPAESEAPG